MVFSKCDASPNGSPSHCSLHNRNPNLKKFNLNDHSEQSPPPLAGEPQAGEQVINRTTIILTIITVGRCISRLATADTTRAPPPQHSLNLTSTNNPNSAAYDQQQMIPLVFGSDAEQLFYATLPRHARISALQPKIMMVTFRQW
ncbi:hypothetical protein TYRP_022584 [Tyrophagus putrescentiae]|nr:hypothetical protein TYRP_022584 [Tyrophagus putrescentiae]